MIIPHSRPMIDADDIEAVKEVLASGHIAQGERVREFETKFAGFVGTKYATAVSSGTSAIHLALKSLGVGRGDEVIMPSYVCSSPYMAALHAGALPRIVDISDSDFNIDVRATRRSITSNSKAIIVPHMFGCPADVDELLEFGVPLIEDCAHSIGAEYKGKKVGTLARVSVFSFYATKIMTTGEGGMILTNEPEIHDKLREMREYDGRSLDITRYNYKMTDMEAALGTSQLRKLPNFITRRRHLASLYSERLSQSKVVLPTTSSYKKPVYYRYIILADQMEALRTSLRNMGVMCERPVSVPLHTSFPPIECPKSNYVYQRALSIPLFPALTDDEANYVIESLTLSLKKFE